MQATKLIILYICLSDAKIPKLTIGDLKSYISDYEYEFCLRNRSTFDECGLFRDWPLMQTHLIKLHSHFEFQLFDNVVNETFPEDRTTLDGVLKAGEFAYARLREA